MDNTEPTIQPIQSHTEILIQQAYDRGYADKAMKVDQAIEMEHSAKGCTRKCHTEPTIDDIEQEITNIFITIDNYGTDEEARVDIRKLISDQVAKAREEERNNVWKSFHKAYDNGDKAGDYIIKGVVKKAHANNKE